MRARRAHSLGDCDCDHAVTMHMATAADEKKNKTKIYGVSACEVQCVCVGDLMVKEDAPVARAAMKSLVRIANRG